MLYVIPQSLTTKLDQLGHQVEWKTIGQHTHYGLCMHCTANILYEHGTGSARYWVRGTALKASCISITLTTAHAQPVLQGSS